MAAQSRPVAAISAAGRTDGVGGCPHHVARPQRLPDTAATDLRRDAVYLRHGVAGCSPGVALFRLPDPLVRAGGRVVGGLSRPLCLQGVPAHGGIRLYRAVFRGLAGAIAAADGGAGSVVCDPEAAW